MRVYVREREPLRQSHTANRLLLVQGPLFGTPIILQSSPAVMWCVKLIMSLGVSSSLIQSSLMWRCRPHLLLSDLGDGCAMQQQHCRPNCRYKAGAVFEHYTGEIKVTTEHPAQECHTLYKFQLCRHIKSEENTLGMNQLLSFA